MPKLIAIHQGNRAGPPKRSDRFVPVLDLIHRQDLLSSNERSVDKPILTPSFTSMEEAEAAKKDLYLAGRYYCSCGVRYCTRKHSNISGCPNQGMRLSIRADIVRDDKGALRVQLRVYDKQEAIRSVIRRYGPDPDKWPYNPRARRLKE